MPSAPNLTTNVLLRSEETDGHVSVTEIVVPPHSAGPPLHTHDFDEAFCVLEGELIFQVDDAPRHEGRGRALLRCAQRSPHARQPQRRARALPAGLHARGLRAPLGAHGRRRGRNRAAGVGAAADPRGHGRRPADRGAGVRPRLACTRCWRRWRWRASTSTPLPSRESGSSALDEKRYSVASNQPTPGAAPTPAPEGRFAWEVQPRRAHSGGVPGGYPRCRTRRPSRPFVPPP